MRLKVEFQGQDEIEIDTENSQHLKVVGCSEVLRLFKTALQQFGSDLKKWQIPTGHTHAEMILREVLLKQRGEWAFPYKDLELCHCRTIPTEVVDQAIVNGASTTDQVSRRTSASTACGTCRPDVQKILDYRRVQPSRG